MRNPYFREWSHAAQPDGFPDQIVWRLGATGDAAVTAVERGGADYTLDPPPPDRMPELRTRFASQLEVNPTDETIVMGLNTKKRPFTDPRVRQALSYAINRSELSQLLGQDSHPTCQMLPPFIPGYQPYCPYTLDPSRRGSLARPQPRQSAKPDRRLGHPRHADHDLEPAGLLNRFHGLGTLRAPCSTSSATRRGSGRSPSTTPRTYPASRTREPALRCTSSTGPRTTRARLNSSAQQFWSCYELHSQLDE